MATALSSLIDSPNPISGSQAVSNRSTAVIDNPRMMQLMKTTYQADQQVKYLHLQAEVESLLQQLRLLKQQRQESVQPDTRN